MGFTQSTYKFYFLSVEEIPETYITMDNLEYFKTNEDQILYFMLDFLNVFDQLKQYKIELVSLNFIFAVVKSTERWIFRVDDIGEFYYVNKPNLYENHIFLIQILERLLLIITNKKTRDFVRDLTFAASLLRSEDYDYYI